jgi:hypothetical protein
MELEDLKSQTREALRNNLPIDTIVETVWKEARRGVVPGKIKFDPNDAIESSDANFYAQGWNACVREIRGRLK